MEQVLEHIVREGGNFENHKGRAGKEAEEFLRMGSGVRLVCRIHHVEGETSRSPTSTMKNFTKSLCASAGTQLDTSQILRREGRCLDPYRRALVCRRWPGNCVFPDFAPEERVVGVTRETIEHGRDWKKNSRGRKLAPNR